MNFQFENNTYVVTAYAAANSTSHVQGRSQNKVTVLPSKDGQMKLADLADL